MIRGRCKYGRVRYEADGDIQGYHAYVGSKAMWHEIADELEQYDAEPPD